MRIRKKTPRTKSIRRRVSVQKANSHRSERSLSHHGKIAVKLARPKPSTDLLERLDFLACLFAK